MLLLLGIGGQRMKISEVITELNKLKCSIDGCLDVDRRDKAIGLAKSALLESQWHNAQTDLPKDDRKKYLVLIEPYGGGEYYHKIASFAQDLYKIDDCDFYNKKGKSGWYNCDSEWSYYEIHGVTYWMELPAPPQEIINE